MLVTPFTSLRPDTVTTETGRESSTIAPKVAWGIRQSGQGGGGGWLQNRNILLAEDSLQYLSLLTTNTRHWPPGR
jgi:hypothetical protein